MTKEQVIELAKQAGASRYTNRHYPERPTHTFTVEQLELFTTLVRNAALEEAAHDCELLLPSGGLYHSEQIIWDIATRDCANAIRNIKEPTP